MEKLLDTIWNALSPFLVLEYILLIIFASNILINKANLHVKISPWFGKEGNTVYAVLILAFILSLPWGIINVTHHEPFNVHLRLAISYCVATSIYEVFIKKFLTGKDKPKLDGKEIL